MSSGRKPFANNTAGMQWSNPIRNNEEKKNSRKMCILLPPAQHFSLRHSRLNLAADHNTHTPVFKLCQGVWHGALPLWLLEGNIGDEKGGERALGTLNGDDECHARFPGTLVGHPNRIGP